MPVFQQRKETWRWTKDRITLLHNRIDQGKVKIPKLDNVIPSALGKGKGIRIEFKEIGYESIQIGGMVSKVIGQHQKSPPIKNVLLIKGA